MTKRRRQVVDPGRFYQCEPDGALTPVVPTAPDVWICRRVDDFPGQRAPEGAALAVCETCGAGIAFNPARLAEVPPETPRVCMQCAGLEPLPIR